MNDLFLKVDGVRTNEEALRWSINAALQRNRVYKSDDDCACRTAFRNEWARMLSEEAKAYRKPAQPISDKQHCAAIIRMSDELSSTFSDCLSEGRLRFGTVQKAFNLYLKYLWALNEIEMPPHCPVDSVVLARIGITSPWTKCDSCEEYMDWINEIRRHLSLAEWENEVWLRWRLSTSGF
jgi:hypothetical protein